MASRSLKHRKNIRKHDIKSGLLSLLFIFIGIVIIAIVGFYFLCCTWLTDIPDYSTIDKFNRSSTSKIYASDQQTVLAEFQLENRTPVELDKVSDYVKQGTIATEDIRFYSHNGFDLHGTMRATVTNLLGGSLEGASTITMQLVRNTVISDEMSDISFKRKIREIYIALKMEELYSKDEILQMYLNTINYGSGAYGIEAASNRYFSKSADQLNLAESATLVGIPQSPTYNNPIDNYENCVERRNLVLNRMLTNGFISQDQYDEAINAELVLTPREPKINDITQYPYFTSYVRNQLTSENNDYSISAADVFSGGLSIITTLDVQAQEKLTSACLDKSRAVNFDVASVAIDPNNGYIKAIQDCKDYTSSQLNMATGDGTNGRQVGSSFKVFTLLAAIEAGIDPATNIDATSSMVVNGSTISNYGHNNYGVRSIASALAYSSNTAFVRLCNSVGPAKVAEVAKRLGITASLPEVPVLTLGVASITPLQMAGAYATIANGGTYYKPECIQKITDNAGNVIVDNTNPKGKKVLSAEVACMATEVMKRVLVEGVSTDSNPRISQPIAGKSGTTDDGKDSWFVGFTPQICAAFWMGDPATNYTEAKGIPDGYNVHSAFANFMRSYSSGLEVEQFPVTEKPNFTANFSDTTNHIGGAYGYSSSFYNYTVYKNTTNSYNSSNYYNYQYYNSGNSGNSSSQNSGTTNNSNSNTNSSQNSTEGNSSTNSQGQGTDSQPSSPSNGTTN